MLVLKRDQLIFYRKDKGYFLGTVASVCGLPADNRFTFAISFSTIESMKKASLLLLCGLTLAACNDQKTTNTKVEGEDAVIQTSPSTQTAPTVPAGKFDWANIPVSNVEIGAFPYVTAPTGFMVVGGKSNYAASENGMTDFEDFSKLLMYDGQGFFDAEGKRARLRFDMVSNDDKWNQYKFDQSVDTYLEGIGAKIIFKGKIPRAQLDALDATDDLTTYKYMAGDPSGSDVVRHYALNHATAGKIFF